MRIPEGLSKRDYTVINLYTHWFKAAELVSKLEMEVAFFKGSQWPDREGIAIKYLKDAQEEQNALNELMIYSKAKPIWTRY